MTILGKKYFYCFFNDDFRAFLALVKDFLVTLQTMERIALNKNEKKVLRMLSNGQDNLLNEYDIPDVCSLEVKG